MGTKRQTWLGEVFDGQTLLSVWPYSHLPADFWPGDLCSQGEDDGPVQVKIKSVFYGHGAANVADVGRTWIENGLRGVKEMTIITPPSKFVEFL